MEKLYLKYKDFNFQEFKKLVNGGDIMGLDYLEETIINKMKKEYDLVKFKKQDYIVSLFYAVKELNNCVWIYETTNVENNFDYDLYTGVRNKLFMELGFNIEKLWD